LPVTGQNVCIPTFLASAAAGSAATINAETTNAAAIQTCINTASAAGTATLPGLVILQPYNGIGTASSPVQVGLQQIFMKSNVVVALAPDFMLQGPDPLDVGYTGTAYSGTSPYNSSGTATTPNPTLTNNSFLISSVSGSSNMTITGTGIIDGNGANYWSIVLVYPSSTATVKQPGKMIDIKGTGMRIGANFNSLGQNVTPTYATGSTVNPAFTAYYSGAGGNPSPIGTLLTIRKAPQVHLQVETGNDAIIDGVWIYSNPGYADVPVGKTNAYGAVSAGQKNVNLAPNTDAIDVTNMNSDGLHATMVRNCIIDTGDDDISLKSNKAGLPTVNTTVQNCVIGGGHGLSIGGQEEAGVYNTTASNVWFKGTPFGLKVKTNDFNGVSGDGTGTNPNSGPTMNAHYHNICMQDVAMPIQLTLRYAGNIPTKAAGMAQPPVISNITFDNVIATNTELSPRMGSSSGSGCAGQLCPALGDISGTDPNNSVPSSDNWTVAPSGGTIPSAYATLDLIQNVQITNSAFLAPAGTAFSLIGAAGSTYNGTTVISPFTIEQATVMVGTHTIFGTASSAAPYSAANKAIITPASYGRVIPIPDVGPTFACPTTDIVIPTQQ
jgi:polygalacturonase